MALTNTTINAKTTHDLWIEAREFTLAIARPTPTTISLTITYPTALSSVDGAIVTIDTKAINANNWPTDGERYLPSTDLDAPASRIVSSSGAQVVAFYSGILGSPLPGVANIGTGISSFVITITNTDPNALYYASVHASTNVLQYYPIGIQSYPLEASRVEKDGARYTGNIPSLPDAPTSPQPGFVYHDKGLNLTQYWTGTQWISTRSDTIISGAFNPGSLGQAYFFTGQNQIKLFDGTNWVTATPSNLEFLIPGPTWVPLGAVDGLRTIPETPALGDFFWDYTLQRAQFWDGSNWVSPNASNSLFMRPSPTPAFTGAVYAEPTQLSAPYIGQLFYNLNTRVLNVFTGVDWRQANTDQQGTPSTDKVNIGTDGSYDERLRVIKIIKAQLGWPVQCVELKEEQFNVAIDNALDNYRMLSDAAYTTKFVLFSVVEGQQTYYLNSAVDGTDKIVSVNKIHRLNILGANSLNWDSNVYFQTFLNQYYSSGYTDILSIHLTHSLSEDFQRIFAGDLMFLWDEPSRELLITRRLARREKVLIECYMERSEQELLLDRWAKQFLQNWALAETKMMLGLIRSKFSSGTPGAGGPINLNGEMLVAEARQDMTELKEEMLNYEYGGLVGKGNVSFLLG